MCGRFEPVTLEECEQIAERLGTGETFDDLTLMHTRPSDAYPRRNAPLIIADDPSAHAFSTQVRQWGFLPAGITDAVFNTRIETASELPLWREAYTQSRCVVPVRAYFEPHATERGTRPDTHKEVAQLYRFSAPEHSDTYPLVFLAGVYNAQYFSIMTCAPDALMKPIHNRMPIALTRDGISQWLSDTYTQIIRSEGPIKAEPFYPPAPHYEQMSLF